MTTNGHAYKIEDGIPMPGAKSGSGFADCLRRMGTGQSILVAGAQSQSSVFARAYSVSKRSADSRKFATRKVEGGVRVWRTA